MGFEYIRKLMPAADADSASRIKEKLLAEHIEVYSRSAEGDAYKLVDPEESCLDHEIYVTAADHAHASEIASGMGYGSLICECRPAQEELTEVQKAEAEFMRKRKRTMIEGIVILIAAVIFMFFRCFLK